MTHVDDYDLKILTLLQSNGRLTNQELSDLVAFLPHNVPAVVSIWNRLI